MRQVKIGVGDSARIMGEKAKRHAVIPDRYIRVMSLCLGQPPHLVDKSEGL